MKKRDTTPLPSRNIAHRSLATRRLTQDDVLRNALEQHAKLSQREMEQMQINEVLNGEDLRIHSRMSDGSPHKALMHKQFQSY